MHRHEDAFYDNIMSYIPCSMWKYAKKWVDIISGLACKSISVVRTVRIYLCQPFPTIPLV